MDIIVQILLSFVYQKPVKQLCLISSRSKRRTAGREKNPTPRKRLGLHLDFQGIEQIYIKNNF